MGNIVSRAWSAVENSQPGGDGAIEFYVTGEVQVIRGNLVPVLHEPASPGLNEKILLLDLSFDECGDAGSDIVCFKPVRFDKVVSRKQEHETVEIRHENELVTSIKVTFVD